MTTPLTSNRYFLRLQRKRQDGIKPLFRLGAFCAWVGLLLSLSGTNSWGGAWPFDADAVARVRVRSMGHSLLESDIRRVEHGAPPPLVPYEARLDIIAVHPPDRLVRLMVEGIVATSWMPRPEDSGIIALHKTAARYTPAAPFPVSGYLPETMSNNARYIEFPPGSGNPVRSEFVWECVCDLVDRHRGEETEAARNRWQERLNDAAPATALTALLYLTQSADAALAWESLTERFVWSEDAPDFSVRSFFHILARYAATVHGDAAFDLFIEEMAHRPLSNHFKDVGPNALALAARQSPPRRLAALMRLLTAEYGRDPSGQPVAQDMDCVEAALAETTGDDVDLLLGEMLKAPLQFPFIRTRADVEKLWRWLANRDHADLGPYLEQFARDPDATALPFPITSQELRGLATLARQLGAASNGNAP